MPPVRPHRIISFALVHTLIAGVTAASGLQDTVAQCQAIEDRHARLACFDALPHSDTRAQPTATADTRIKSQPADAGKASSDMTQGPPRLHEFPKASEIVRLSRTIDERHIFYLEDGTVWQESRNGSHRFVPGHAVSIGQSPVLGSETIASYWMEVDGAKFKVVRLR